MTRTSVRKAPAVPQNRKRIAKARAALVLGNLQPRLKETVLWTSKVNLV